MSRPISRELAILASVALALAALARATGATDYDPAVPTPEAVLGYAIGERITDYHGMEEYFSTLAEASERVVFGSYGEDYEGRELRYVVVSSAKNIGRLDGIREATARLTDPRTLAPDEAKSLAATTPVIVWLNYSTDGNETAGLESALLIAHHLAADPSPVTSGWLDHAVVVMTPVMNPSSHERWASWSNSFAARGGNPDPLAMEHHPPWGVLTNNNHYLVDLNRDSIWATQRESAALRDFYYQWNPAVFVDLHGEYDNFVGPGYEEPLNPLFTTSQRASLDRFGKAIGRRFAGLGWSYSPWETGSFYPGFWESFGLLNGAVGFTFETIGGGSKGLRYRRQDGSVITLLLAARQHLEASLAVIETAVAARADLLESLYDFRASASGSLTPEQAFLVEPGNDPRQAAAMLETLTAHGVEVYRSERELSARDVHSHMGGSWRQKTFAPGTWVIPVDQPQARLLVTMMRKDLELPEETVRAAEAYRENQEDPGFYHPGIWVTGSPFYDVTAWSMPLTYGVDGYWTEAPLPGPLGQRWESWEQAPHPPIDPGTYGYLIAERGNSTVEFLVDLLNRGLVVNIAWEGFAIEGNDYPRGTLLVRNERNPGVDLPAVLQEAATRHSVQVRPVSSVYSDSGPSLGSDRFVHVKKPRVAVLAGDPVSVRSFGDLWFTLERLYELEFTAIYKEQLDAEALATCDVLVLPDGWYGAGTFSEEWVAELKAWIGRGGTLVTFRRASEWATDPDLELTGARTRPRQWPIDPTDGEESRTTLRVPGAIFKADVQPDHFLTMGGADELAVLVRSNLAFAPGAELATPVRLSETDEAPLAGFVYEDSALRLTGTPYLLHERFSSGNVVLFLDDPAFRVYWQGQARLALNSILLGSAF